MYMFAYVCICLYLFVCLYVHVYAYAYVYVYVCVYVCVYVYVYVYVCIYACMFILAKFLGTGHFFVCWGDDMGSAPQGGDMLNGSQWNATGPVWPKREIWVKKSETMDETWKKTWKTWWNMMKPSIVSSFHHQPQPIRGFKGSRVKRSAPRHFMRWWLRPSCGGPWVNLRYPDRNTSFF